MCEIAEKVVAFLEDLNENLVQSNALKQSKSNIHSGFVVRVFEVHASFKTTHKKEVTSHVALLR